MDQEQPAQITVQPTDMETKDTSIQQNETESTVIQPEIKEMDHSKCSACVLLQLDLDQAKQRNEVLFKNYELYRDGAERTCASKDAEITRLNTETNGLKEEIKTLNETIAKLTEDLTKGDAKQQELNSAISGLKDELVVERSKNSQLSLQYTSLQFKLAQEKASKSIKSTAASLASSVRSISQDLFTKKTDVVVLNEGYSTFLSKYEADVKRLEGALKQLEASYEKISADWRNSEEEHKKHQTELLDENSALREEKRNMESSLRSSIQTLETANAEMEEELQQVRLQYKVSDQIENSQHIDRLDAQIKQLQQDKEAAEKERETEKSALESELAEIRSTCETQSKLIKSYEQKLMEFEDVDAAKVEEEEYKRVVKRISAWEEDKREYDEPGFDLNDESVQSLMHIWKTDDATRAEVMKWMQEYMTKIQDDEKVEIVLPNMPIEVYEGFAQVIVPILHARANSTIKIFKRQSVYYDMKLSAGSIEFQPLSPYSEDMTPKSPVEMPATPTTENAEVKQKKSLNGLNGLYVERKWLWND